MIMVVLYAARSKLVVVRFAPFGTDALVEGLQVTAASHLAAADADVTSSGDVALASF